MYHYKYATSDVTARMPCRVPLHKCHVTAWRIYDLRPLVNSLSTTLIEWWGWNPFRGRVLSNSVLLDRPRRLNLWVQLPRREVLQRLPKKQHNTSSALPFSAAHKTQVTLTF